MRFATFALPILFVSTGSFTILLRNSDSKILFIGARLAGVKLDGSCIAFLSDGGKTDLLY
jgi:hypothetical protein